MKHGTIKCLSPQNLTDSMEEIFNEIVLLTACNLNVSVLKSN